MSKAAPKIVLTGLTFTGSDHPAVAVSFKDGLNVLFGASNTGKTFTVKSIDFMLGGKGSSSRISANVLDMKKLGWASSFRAPEK